MISFVRGRLAAIGADSAVVEVGGVGLALSCTPATLATLHIGEEARLPTALIVREDSLTLYGFADEDERHVFTLLQSVSGVGPRLALALLAVHSPDALREAVATEDHAALMKVPGVGRKGAQRLVLELRDRLGAVTGGPSPTLPDRAAAAAPWREQLRSALLGLGWSVREADAAVDAVAPQAGEAEESPDVAALLRAALRTLTRA
jgi:holliday junction DNA helicase RuvA